MYLATDVFSPVSRKVRSVSLPTEALSPRQEKKKGNSVLCPICSGLLYVIEKTPQWSGY